MREIQAFDKALVRIVVPASKPPLVSYAYTYHTGQDIKIRLN